MSASYEHADTQNSPSQRYSLAFCSSKWNERCAGVDACANHRWSEAIHVNFRDGNPVSQGSRTESKSRLPVLDATRCLVRAAQPNTT